MKIFVCIFCLYCNATIADTLYKCQNESGSVIYQQSKCTSVDQPLSSWNYKTYQAPKFKEEKIVPYSMVLLQGARGHYTLEAEIDSGSAIFLIDTGATKVTLTEATARAAGLSCTGTQPLLTASTVVMACITTISNLTFGKFVIKNIPALIVPHAQINLLGMNVLGQLKIEQGRGKMILSMPN